MSPQTLMLKAQPPEGPCWQQAYQEVQQGKRSHEGAARTPQNPGLEKKGQKPGVSSST